MIRKIIAKMELCGWPPSTEGSGSSGPTLCVHGSDRSLSDPSSGSKHLEVMITEQEFCFVFWMLWFLHGKREVHGLPWLVAAQASQRVLSSLGSPDLDPCGYGCGSYCSFFLSLLWRVVFGYGMQDVYSSKWGVIVRHIICCPPSLSDRISCKLSRSFTLCFSSDSHPSP